MLNRPARWFHGWNVVGTAFLSQGFAIGLSTSTYGVYVLPIGADLDASRFQTTLGYALLMAGLSVTAPIAGRLIERGSIRVIMIAGMVLLASGLVLLSVANHIAQIILIYATFIAVGATLAGALPASTLVVNWFDARRGRALGISTVGASAGGLVLPPVAANLIEQMGWRASCQVLAVAAVLIAVPLIYWAVSNRPEDRSLVADGLQRTREPQTQRPIASSVGVPDILRSPAFWAVAVAAGAGNCVTSGLLVNIVPLAVDHGYEHTRSAYLISIFTVGLVAGKLLIGAASDRFRTATLWQLSLGLAALGVLLVANVTSLSGLAVACAIAGLGSGGYYPLIGMSIADSFPRPAFGRVMGLVLPVLYLIALPGAPLAGLVFDRAGSYVPAMWAFAGTLAVGAMAIRLGKPGRVSPGR